MTIADPSTDPGTNALVDHVVDRLRALDSTVVSAALDGLDLPGGLGALRPAWGTPRFVGRARTVVLEGVAGMVVVGRGGFWCEEVRQVVLVDQPFEQRGHAD